MKKRFLGKYKSIVISISLFVSLIVGVMTLNLLISSELERSAIEISIAGRQRMLSQRLFKDLLSLQRESESGGDISNIEEEIVKTANLFDKTLSAFSYGGVITGADGDEVEIKKVESDLSLRALEEAFILWEPFKELVSVLSDEQSDNKWLGDIHRYGLKHFEALNI